MTRWLGQKGDVLVYIVNFTLNESKDVMEYICFYKQGLSSAKIRYDS